MIDFIITNDNDSSHFAEFEPAAAVYEIMNGRLISLESRLEELRVEKEQQCGCKNIYTNDEIDQITKASTNDILNTVDKKYVCSIYLRIAMLHFLKLYCHHMTTICKEHL